MRICWAHYLLWAVIAIFGTGALLSSCGQKGPLYLPKDKKEKKKNNKKKATDTKPAGSTS